MTLQGRVIALEKLVCTLADCELARNEQIDELEGEVKKLQDKALYQHEWAMGLLRTINDLEFHLTELFPHVPMFDSLSLTIDYRMGMADHY